MGVEVCVFANVGAVVRRRKMAKTLVRPGRQIVVVVVVLISIVFVVVVVIVVVIIVFIYVAIFAIVVFLSTSS